jgi:hydrogenase expression/formation protein HypC
MCIGLPMRVVAVFPGQALCVVDDEARHVSTLLLDRGPSEGDHVLVHAETAVRFLDAEEASAIHGALAAVLAAVDGRPFEHLIADLADREPQLPAHLR